MLNLDVDVLVPAALENAIIADNAQDVSARVVLEVANGPVTSKADEILAEHDVTVVPDILASGGGVTVSYFEWVQNRTCWKWPPEEVSGRLRARMVRESERLWEVAQDRGLPVRTAAYVLALGRIGDAIDARGSRDTFADDD